MKLNERPPDSVLVGGKKYKVDFDFSTILTVFDVYKDDDLTEADKLELAVSLLFRRSFLQRRVRHKAEFVDAVFNVISGGKKGDGKRVIDFSQDAELIYAAFRQVYGIDLHHCRMHWLVFVALLGALPDNTRLSEVIQIRVKPFPTPNKHNGEEIAQLARLKNIYKIKTAPEEETQNFQNGLMSIVKRFGG